MDVTAKIGESNRVDLYSPLSPEECATRLEAAIDRDLSPLNPLFGYFGSRPIAGRVNGLSFRLRKRIGYRNHFQTFLTGTLRPCDTGTIIQGLFAMHGCVIAFTLFWFASAIVLSGVIFVTSLLGLLLASHPFGSNAWIGFVGLPLVLGFGYLLVHFCHDPTREEARFLITAIREILDARDRQHGTSRSSNR